ncbi:membrane protein [Deltaproteobacteria bacterium]|nr:membrane protein [Deltaproteobacteria bacterium]
MTSFVPTPRFVLLACLPLALAVLGAVVEPLRATALGVDVGLIALAALDALSVRRAALQITRRVRPTWSVNRVEKVTLEVHNASGRILRASVHQTLFEGAESEGLPQAVRLGARTRIEYRAKARERGRRTLGDHHVRIASTLGLWHRQIDVPAADVVQVWPDVKALTQYDLLARAGRQSMLLRVLPRAGTLAEFERLRPWARGDEFRLVDWKATARARQPVVRQLRHATNQNIVFLLDLGRCMTASWEGRSAVDCALDALLLTGHVALRQKDRVGLIAFDDRVRALLKPTAGPRARQALLRSACNLFPTLEEPDFREAFAAVRTHIRARSLLVLFTSVADEGTVDLLKRLLPTVSRHLVLWVCLRDPGVEALANAAPDANPETAWRRGAAAEFLEWRRRVLDDARSRGMHVLDALPSEVTPALLSRYLDVKARQLL